MATVPIRPSGTTPSVAVGTSSRWGAAGSSGTSKRSAGSYGANGRLRKARPRGLVQR